MKTKKKLLNILFLLVVIMTSVVLLFISINNGFSNGSVSHAQTLFWGYLAIFGGGVLTLGILESASENPCHDAVDVFKKRIDNLADGLNASGLDYTKKYINARNTANYNQALDMHSMYKTYYLVRREKYKQQIDELLEEWATAGKPYQLTSILWKVFLSVAVIAQFTSCGYTLGVDIKNSDTESKENHQIYWTAKDVSLPHLLDSTCYVFNPENIVSEHTVSILNEKLQQMDQELGIESAVFIVGHVQNQDIFRFAQDVFDLYKIGRNDRGLVMVLAYEDHVYRTHTGYALESELTDAECHQLEARYLIPYLKAGQPDSAMIHLTSAFYNTLENKPLPYASSSYSRNTESDTNSEDALTGYVFLYLLGLVILFIIYFVVGDIRGWHLRIYAKNKRQTNIFKKELSILPLLFGGNDFMFFSGGGSSSHSGSSRSGGSSWGGGFSWGGGHFSGGHYGGGGSGGGGSTSRW